MTFQDLADKYRTTVDVLNHLNDQSLPSSILLAEGSEFKVPIESPSSSVETEKNLKEGESKNPESFDFGGSKGAGQ